MQPVQKTAHDTESAFECKRIYLPEFVSENDCVGYTMRNSLLESFRNMKCIETLEDFERLLKEKWRIRIWQWRSMEAMVIMDRIMRSS